MLSVGMQTVEFSGEATLIAPMKPSISLLLRLGKTKTTLTATVLLLSSFTWRIPMVMFLTRSLLSLIALMAVSGIVALIARKRQLGK